MASKPPPTLKATRSNAGVEVWLRRRIECEVEAMHRSYLYWVSAAYRSQLKDLAPPDPDDGPLAQDEAPAKLLNRVLQALRRRWGRRYDEFAVQIAERFAKRAGTSTDQAIQAALRGASLRVKLQTTSAQRDQLDAIVRENVSLIKSIHEQYHTAVNGVVMRSVQAGRDLAPMVRDLQEAYSVSHKRASLIARDQNNKATAFLNKTRQLEVGITQAMWVHSTAGKQPRPSHVKAGRDHVIYNVAEGWLDPAIGKRIWPGTEINCRCTSRSVIPE